MLLIDVVCVRFGVYCVCVLFVILLCDVAWLAVVVCVLRLCVLRG